MSNKRERGGGEKDFEYEDGQLTGCLDTYQLPNTHQDVFSVLCSKNTGMWVRDLLVKDVPRMQARTMQ